MKLISLNTWGGRAGRENLLAFFERNKDADIFCLQEVWSAPHEHLEGRLAGGVMLSNANIQVHGVQEIAEILHEHVPFFRPHLGDNFGLLMFVSKKITVLEEGSVFVYKEQGYVSDGDIGNHARNVQYVTFATQRGNRTALNFHGLWNGNGKGDSEDRLSQSRRIVDVLETIKSPYVLCGDFNLSPDTESLKKLENLGLRNLIKEYGITSTRTSHYTKENKFADYALVSEGIEIKDFKVLPDEVSDHAPLYIEFE